MQTAITAAFNLQPDGTIVKDGEYLPGVSGPVAFDQLGITATRIALGHYRVIGPAIVLPTGWRATAHRDDNDLPTVHLQLAPGDGVIDLFVTDPQTGGPKDIVYLLTFRVSVTTEVLNAAIPIDQSSTWSNTVNVPGVNPAA